MDRYNVDYGGITEPVSDGEIIYYSDHLKEIEGLKEENKRLIEGISSIREEYIYDLHINAIHKMDDLIRNKGKNNEESNI
jgi:hypothetical protein